MHPILLSIMLGLTAAAANVFGGAIIVQRRWNQPYLSYFIALGAGFMLATAIVEIFPASLALRGQSARSWFCSDICSSTFSSMRSLRIFTSEKKPIARFHHGSQGLFGAGRIE